MDRRTNRGVVIVRGAWATPELYASFMNCLFTHGWEVRCPLLPTCNNARPPTSTRDDDVRTIREAVCSLIENGYPVFILMHSYGGVVGGEAAVEDLSSFQRSLAGLPGGIARLVYMSAFIIIPGENIVDAQKHILGGTDSREVASEDMELVHYDDGTSKNIGAAKASFNSLAPAEAEEWASKLPVWPMAAAMEPSTRAPYRTIPTTYVYGKNDRSIKLSTQERCVQRAKELIGICDLVEEYLETDHSPQLSAPAEIIAVLERAWLKHERSTVR
ncbi:MAG: hypothetical protein Q9162_004141 [Coniocarpon cinnabarinum]